MKDLFCTIMRTFGIIASTSKESFMEGWNNPYIANEEVVEEDDDGCERELSDQIAKARQIDEEMQHNASYL